VPCPVSRIPYPGQVGSGSDECGIIACCFCQWHCHTTADVVGRKHAAANEWAWDSAVVHTPYAAHRTPYLNTPSPYSTVTGRRHTQVIAISTLATSSCVKMRKKRRNSATDVFIYKATRNSLCVLPYILTPECQTNSWNSAQANGFKFIGK